MNYKITVYLKDGTQLRGVRFHETNDPQIAAKFFREEVRKTIDIDLIEWTDVQPTVMEPPKTIIKPLWPE